MISAHVFIAASLDGFIARPDGGIDWLERLDLTGEDHGYEAFIARIDGLLMGRGTFETALGFEPWPYTLPVAVLSRSLTMADIPQRLDGKVRILNLSPGAALRALADEGWRRVYVDGGAVIQSFLRDGLIEDMILTRIPVLLGAGRPLFGPLPQDVELDHLSTRSFPSGLVQSHYRLRKQAPDVT